MKVDVSKINKVFGDRILIKRLERPEKIGGILVPQSYAQEKRKEQTVWFGVIEKFGLDSRYGDAYGLCEGDIVGVSDIANSNASFEDTEGLEHFWVMEEFIVFKDDGRVMAFRSNVNFSGVGLLPVGPYCIVLPYPEEEKKGGIFRPHNADNENLTGKVVAVSEGDIKDGELTSLRVNLDSDVLFGKYSGLAANFFKDKFLLIKEEDLIAEFEKQPENQPEKELINA